MSVQLTKGMVLLKMKVTKINFIRDAQRMRLENAGKLTDAQAKDSGFTRFLTDVFRVAYFETKVHIL